MLFLDLLEMFRVPREIVPKAHADLVSPPANFFDNRTVFAHRYPSIGHSMWGVRTIGTEADPAASACRPLRSRERQSLDFTASLKIGRIYGVDPLDPMGQYHGYNLEIEDILFRDGVP